MPDMNSYQIGSTASALDGSSSLSALSNRNQQPSSNPATQSQRTSALALHRNPSLNSTASSTTHGTSITRRSRESTSSASRGTSHASKLSVDEILSSKKYSLDGRKRKTWTREEIVHANNVRMLKNLKKTNSVDHHSKLVNNQSPKRYSFPSEKECLRRLESPVKESKVARDVDNNSSQTEEVPRNESKQDVTINEIKTTDGQEEYKLEMTSSRVNAYSSQSLVLVNPKTKNESTTKRAIQIADHSSSPKKQHRSTNQTATEAASQLIEKYNSSLRQKGQTPFDVVQLFCPLLNYLDCSSHRDKAGQSENVTVVLEGLSQILKSVENVKLEVMSRGCNGSEGDAKDSREDGHNLSLEEKLLRILQIQIWIRIMVWNFSREDGWNLLRSVLKSQRISDGPNEKRLKSNGKHKKTKRESTSDTSLPSGQSFVKEIISLCELAPYVLPPSLEFSQWLKNTLTFNFQQSIPEFGSEILDHFEIEFAENSARSMFVAVIDSSTLKKAEVTSRAESQSSAGGTSLSRTVANGSIRQQAFFSSLARNPLGVNADGESATIGSDESVARSHSISTESTKTTGQRGKEADAALLKTSLSLTAVVPKRKENPFLKDSARGVYVGSHLSSKLSNIATLFREVKAPPKPKPVVMTAKKMNPLLHYDKLSLMDSARMPSNEPVSTFTSIMSKPGVARQSLDPTTETPRKRSKPTPDSEWSNIHLPSVNNYVTTTPLKIIGETPSKKPRNAARGFKTALDGIFVRQSVEMTPQHSGVNSRYERMQSDSNATVGGNLCFGLSPMPQQRKRSKFGPKGRRKKWT